ncbi:MAG: hypothetical protein QCI00_01660 [Candidatus Thermoplasmatota archaeon]|nr:hypothetical protein [Candidatus Thermoplasmatota archaeon]
MKKNIIIISLIIILINIGFSGCTDNDNSSIDPSTSDTEKFIGTWNTTQPIQWYIKPSFTFFSNQSFLVQTTWGTYSAMDNTLVLTWETNDITNYSYSFLDDNTVELTYINTGDTGVYTRQ